MFSGFAMEINTLFLILTILMNAFTRTWCFCGITEWAASAETAHIFLSQSVLYKSSIKSIKASWR
jgi:hypothetical protein